MKIPVKSFVRTKEGLIAQRVSKCKITYPFHSSIEGMETDVDIVWFNDVKAFSMDIIDLIEEGDYVNGCLIVKIGESLLYEAMYNNSKVAITNITWSAELNGHYHEEIVQFGNNDIKDVVTHEQFNSVKYVLGGGKKDE